MQRVSSSKNSGHTSVYSGPGGFVTSCIECQDGSGGPKHHYINPKAKFFRCPQGHVVSLRPPAGVKAKRP